MQTLFLPILKLPCFFFLFNGGFKIGRNKVILKLLTVYDDTATSGLMTHVGIIKIA